MARTESTSIQVHPRNEQSQIDLMQKFHWSLLNSQEIKTIDNHLERRGDDMYQVTNTEHYIKLTFSRDLELPNLNEVKRLEQEYFSLGDPTYPKAFTGLMAVGLVVLFAFIASSINGTLAFIVTAGAYAAYFFMAYTPKKQTAGLMTAKMNERKHQIMTAVAQFA